MSETSTPAPSILIIGASRGLGLAMAAEFLKRGWNVTGTVRAGSGRNLLRDLTDTYPNRLGIETVDITVSDQIRVLRERMSARTFDILFVNAGIANPDPTQTVGEVSTEEFVNVMVTNALGPMRVVDNL